MIFCLKALNVSREAHNKKIVENVEASGILSAPFEKFIIKFNKTYTTQNERDRALQNFAKDYVTTKAHNIEFVAKNVSFGRRINQLSDAALAKKIRILNGLKMPSSSASSTPSNFNDYDDHSRKSSASFNPFLPPSSSSSRRKRQAFTSTNFPRGPSEFDWRKLGAVNEPSDQGFSCLSCWAFAATGTMEAQFFKITGVLPKFSEQNLIDCNFYSATGNWGCDVSCQQIK